MRLTPENIKGLDNLANAIVVKAADDYKKAYMRYLKKKDSQSELDTLRHFFRSQWCMALTDVNTELLMQDIEKECKERFERKKNHGKSHHKNQVPEGHTAD